MFQEFDTDTFIGTIFQPDTLAQSDIAGHSVGEYRCRTCGLQSSCSFCSMCCLPSDCVTCHPCPSSHLILRESLPYHEVRSIFWTLYSGSMDLSKESLKRLSCPWTHFILHSWLPFPTPGQLPKPSLRTTLEHQTTLLTRIIISFPLTLVSQKAPQFCSITEEKIWNIILFLFSRVVIYCDLGNENGQLKETMLYLPNCPRTFSLKVSHFFAFCQEIAWCRKNRKCDVSICLTCGVSKIYRVLFCTHTFPFLLGTMISIHIDCLEFNPSSLFSLLELPLYCFT